MLPVAGMKSYDPLLGTWIVVPENSLIEIASFLNFDLFVRGGDDEATRKASCIGDRVLKRDRSSAGD